jgi:hypothetical protein
MTAILYFLIGIWLCSLFADIPIGLIELVAGISLLVLGAILLCVSTLLNDLAGFFIENRKFYSPRKNSHFGAVLVQ